MIYSTLINYMVTGTYAALFASLMSSYVLLKAGKAPFYHLLALVFCIILSLTGLVLSSYDFKLGVDFTPYALGANAILFITQDLFYLSRGKDRVENWPTVRNKVYTNIIGSLIVIVFLVFVLSFKNQISFNRQTSDLSRKIDTVLVNSETNKELLLKNEQRTETLADSLQVTNKKLEQNNKTTNSILREKLKDKKTLKTINKKTASVKEDTEVIKEKIEETEQTPKPKEKKGFFDFLKKLRP